MITICSFKVTDAVTHSYIDTYRDLAIIEMYRTGVPASITLAQAIHESASGTSNLASNSNNHFGIKCKSYWRGRSYYHVDDDRNNRGELIESCFRAYDFVEDSFIDHSNFLKYSAHYQKLFQLKRNDHIGWANGLKECGYATDKRYTQKLIRIIEKYNLAVYDSWEDPRNWNVSSRAN
ncbi:glycoside hydrolase family 73 protein [Portibacter marinus]|uniref:glycoside hydrolase family 73 protein n=1 Tax=Portibacter marinus TaxID=2898660 RepID=UPI001F291891|nr:glucosaminidase domain-containing protein [Portibacter marinus]